MRSPPLFIPLVFFLKLVNCYVPEVEEELLATIIIRSFFKNEETYRFFLPYDRALVKSAAPHALRLAFHMNMGKSDGCIDMTNSFSNGLQNFTTKVEENHRMYSKIRELFRNVYIADHSKKFNGSDLSITHFPNHS